ncbi:hypothetical protein HRbin36_02031 [bacterium HR36]|nr:hypothetical protein HRbin36_02031 [bacterium HR36]
MMLAGARELANEFAKGFSKGRPSHEDDPIGWFRYCTKALELMLTTTQYKIGLMIWTCIRQLSDGNPVGSVLPMRSAIEHYAVAVYLGDRLERAWDEVVKGSSSGKIPVDRLLKLEEQVARFLAGTKGTEEEATKWKEEWSQLGLDRAINLRSATETGLANDVLGFLYDFGSRVIHGERARGVELCPPTHEVYCRANLSRALLGLDLLVSIEYMPNTLRNGVAVLRKLQALARALAKPGANQTKILRTIAMARDKLIQGKHFTGSGTMDNPFVFAEGLEYYFAFYKLCEQLSLDTAQRTLVHSPSGRFFDAVPDKSGRLFYFAVPMEQFGSHQEGEV